MNEANRAVVVRPGEGRRVGNVELLARSEDTPRFNLALITIQPHRGGPPVHAHEAEDDAFYILEGELTFIVGDSEVVTGPGTFVLVPPGIQHTFANRGDEVVRMLNVHAPAGFDRRLEEDSLPGGRGSLTRETRRCSGFPIGAPRFELDLLSTQGYGGMYAGVAGNGFSSVISWHRLACLRGRVSGRLGT